MAEGWIKVYRKIRECWIYDDKPFDRTHAWVDILLRANHQDKKIALGNEFIEIKRGSFVTSELKLANTWGWSKTKLRNFLKVLKDDGMIEINADKKKTTITIVNYSVYQYFENQEKTIKEPRKNQEKTIKEPRKNTNNNDKNEKNEKKDINSSSEYEQQAEDLWRIYPSKTGKGKVINKIPKIIKIHGYDQLARAIGRYKNYVDNQRTNGFTELKYQNGSTFFNSGYIDYLDENYIVATEEKPKASDPWTKMSS